MIVPRQVVPALVNDTRDTVVHILINPILDPSLQCCFPRELPALRFRNTVAAAGPGWAEIPACGGVASHVHDRVVI